MTDKPNKMQDFVKYVRSLAGDQKSESQVFCDRLFQAFGHQAYREAGAKLECRVKSEGKSAKIADLLWGTRLLLQIKSRGKKLGRYSRQAFEYWFQLVPQHPRYAVLCDFDEFWIYDTEIQWEEPADRVKLEELPERYMALHFLFHPNKKPQNVETGIGALHNENIPLSGAVKFVGREQ